MPYTVHRTHTQSGHAEKNSQKVHTVRSYKYINKFNKSFLKSRQSKAKHRELEWVKTQWKKTLKNHKRTRLCSVEICEYFNAESKRDWYIEFGTELPFCCCPFFLILYAIVLIGLIYIYMCVCICVYVRVPECISISSSSFFLVPILLSFCFGSLSLFKSNLCWYATKIPLWRQKGFFYGNLF